MAMSALSALHFHNDEAARTLIEGLRWPTGPVCGHCGESGRRYATKRPGRYRCGNPDCRKDFTVTTGTVMESSHVSLSKWMTGFYLVSSSKKGFSAHQLHRTLGVTYKTAWFMHHRIREAMRAGGLDIPPMGGEGQVVEADETYFGKTEVPRPRNKYLPPPTKGGKTGPANKRAVVSLVERGGNVRSFHVARADALSVQKIMDENVKRETILYTDESRLYTKVGKEFALHATVNHASGEYVRKGEIHTNTVEGYFSIFKRGMKGVYQHCAEKHLHRYLAEFDFRYNHRKIDDVTRTQAAVKGAEGKRLTYRQP
jgi:transposase-like protein